MVLTINRRYSFKIMSTHPRRYSPWSISLPAQSHRLERDGQGRAVTARSAKPMAGEPMAEHPHPVGQACDAASTLIADWHAGVALARGAGNTGGPGE